MASAAAESQASSGSEPASEATKFRGWEQPEPSVRLHQIVNFLGDEDFHRKLHFITHLAEIEEYLEHLKPTIASEVKSSDIEKSYNDAVVMVQVHKHFLRKSAKETIARLLADIRHDTSSRRELKEAEIAWVEKIQSEKPEASLSVGDVPKPMRIRSRGDAAKSQRRIKSYPTFLRPEKPPFTLVKEPDHAEFRKVFRDKIEGISKRENKYLVDLEKEAYAETLQKPRTVEDFDDARLHGTENNFEARAKLRGARRAGIEMLLNMIGGNKEQLRYGEKFRQVQFPTWSPPPKEIPLSLPLPPTQRPLELPTFYSTTAMLQARRAIQADYEQSLMANPIDFDGAIQMPIPRDFAAPQVFLEGDELDYAYTEYEREKAATREECLDLYRDFQKNDLQRPLSETIASYIQKAIESSEVPSKVAKADYVEISPSEVKATLRSLLDKPRSQAAHLVLQDDWKPHHKPPNRKTIEFAKRVMSLEDKISIWRSVHDVKEGTPIETVVKMVVDQKLAEQTAGNQKQKGEQVSAAEPFVTDKVALEMLRFMQKEKLIWLSGEDDRIQVWRGRSVSPERLYAIGLNQTPPESYVSSIRLLSNKFKHVDWLLIDDPEHFFIILAYKLGLMIKEATSGYHNGKPVYPTPAQRIEYYFHATQLSKKSMAESHELVKLERNPLRAHAKELNTHVRSLVAEANLENFCPESSSEKDCAKIVQMEILEELNSNVDLIFPEREEVWDFAIDRLGVARQPGFIIPDKETLKKIRTTVAETEEEVMRLLNIQANTPQEWTREHYDEIVKLEDKMADLEDATGITKPVKRFFNVRSWPVESQIPEIQEALAHSGPVVQEKPQEVKVPAESELSLARKVPKQPLRNPREQHYGRGQWPMMPFGETKYQQSWLSFRMNSELRNVPQFMPKDKHGNLINSAGYLVDENLNLINQAKQHVNLKGEAVLVPIKAPTRPKGAVPYVPPVRKPKNLPGRYALPRLGPKWKPTTISERALERGIVTSIHEDRELVAQVGPDSVAFDNMVMSEPATELLYNLEQQGPPPVTSTGRGKRRAEEIAESPAKKKKLGAMKEEVLGNLRKRTISFSPAVAGETQALKEEVLENLRKRNIGSSPAVAGDIQAMKEEVLGHLRKKNMRPLLAVDSDTQQATRSEEEKQAAELNARMDRLFKNAHETLGPLEEANEEVQGREEVEEESSGDSQLEHENEMVEIPSDGGQPTRYYTYKGKPHSRPFTIEENKEIDDAWRKMQEAPDYLSPVDAALSMSQPGDYEAFKARTLAERLAAKEAADTASGLLTTAPVIRAKASEKATRTSPRKTTLRDPLITPPNLVPPRKRREKAQSPDRSNTNSDMAPPPPPNQGQVPTTTGAVLTGQLATPPNTNSRETPRSYGANTDDSAIDIVERRRRRERATREDAVRAAMAETGPGGSQDPFPKVPQHEPEIRQPRGRNRRHMQGQ